jgi:hypothetical protein
MTVALVDKIAWPVSSNYSIKPGVDTVGKGGYNLLATTSDPDAVIEALFASGEEGAWYDPSDFSTMFQDSAGATPVTAVGQPVGLILDKSQSIVLGVNWFSGFSSVSSPWVSNGGTSYSIDGSQVGDKDISGTVSAIPAYDVFYKWVINASSVSGEVITYTATPSPSKTIVNGANTIIANATSANIIIRAPAGATCIIESVTCQRIYGNHATQATAASRPVLANNAQTKPYRNFDAVDDSMGTTFPSSLGSACTVGRSDPSTGAVILTAQTIGTSYSATADDCLLVIVNRALTGQETTDLTAYLNGKAGL